MTRQLAAAAALILGVAACNKSSSPDDSLKSDLDRAASNGIELAPTGSQSKVISSIERAPDAQTTAPARHQRVAPPPVTPVSDPTPAAVVEAPAPPPAAVTNTPLPEERRPQQRQTPANGGRGYKTVGEVIRDAPFPINP